MRKVVFLVIIFCTYYRVEAQQHLQTVYSTGGSINTNGAFQSIGVVGQAAVGIFSASGYSGSFGYLNTEDQLFTEIRDKSIKEKQIFIFPNPNEGSFRVSSPFANGEVQEVLVLNVLGQRIFSIKNPTLANLSIELGVVPSGMYRLLFQAGDVLYQKQLMVR